VTCTFVGETCRRCHSVS